jgi:hypothetical protein
MFVPKFTGLTAPSPGPYAIDSFKVGLRHQNTHALTNACFLLGVDASGTTSPTVTSARMFFGAVGLEIFRYALGHWVPSVRASLCVQGFADSERPPVCDCVPER